MKKTRILRIMYITIILFIILVICLIRLNNKKENKEQINSISEEHRTIQKDNTEIKIKNKYECNEFKYITITIEDLISAYLNIYKSNVINNPEKAYESLDKEYREKKFTNVDEYRNYINNNLEKVYNSEIIEYKIEKQENKTTYICRDQYENYYIFIEVAAFNYTIMLDDYTIDLPEFIEKYNSTNEEGKVILNIDKFFRALNNGDYKYAYNCLADSFKNNYFKTQTEFEEYAKENLSNSKVQYNTFEAQGEIYSYKVTLTNKETEEQKTKTFIMKLEEGTEFKLSFNR